MRLRCRRTPLSKQEQNTESAEPVETGTIVTAMQAEISRLRAELERAGSKFSRICQQAPADSAQHKPGDVWHIASDGEDDCAEALREESRGGPAECRP